MHNIYCVDRRHTAKDVAAAIKTKLSGAFGVFGGARLLPLGTVVALTFAQPMTAVAAVAISDAGLNANGAGPASKGGTTGGLGASASGNSIAMVGDGDCNRLTNITPQGIYGRGDANYTGGLFGFGVQKSAASYDDQNNVGAGQPYGYKGYTPQTVGYVSGSLNGIAQTQAWGLNSIALGCDSKANGFGASAMGWGAQADGAGSVALGVYSQALGQGSVAFGVGARALAVDTIAAGTLATASATESIALGAGAVSSAAGAVALGSRSVADRGAVASIVDPLSYDGSTVTTTVGAVSVGAASGQRQIANVAAGTADTDAVNVAQVKGVKAVVDRNATSIAQNAADIGKIGDGVARLDASVGDLDTRVTKNGSDLGALQSRTDESFARLDTRVTKNGADLGALQSRTDESFARLDTRVTKNGADLGALQTRADENFARLDTSVGDLDDRVARQGKDIGGLQSRIDAGAIGLVRQDPETGDLLVGNQVGGSAVSFAGAAGSRRLTDVADGVNARDAINFGQLSTVKSAVEQNATAIAQNAADIGKVSDGVARLDTSVGDLDTRVTKNGTDLGALQTRADENFARLDTSVGDLDTRVTKNGTDLGALQTRTDENFARLDTSVGDLDTRVTKNGTDLGALQTRTDENFARLDTSVGDLDTRVTKNGTDLGALQTRTDENFTRLDTSVGDLDDRVARQGKDIGGLQSRIDAGEIGLVRQDSSGTLGIGNDLGGSEISFAGVAGNRRLTGVADGDVSDASADAVNGKQLYASNARIDVLEATSVLYDDASKRAITFNPDGNAVQLKNVAAGTDDSDAVTLGQLKQSGMINQDGSIAGMVAYDDSTRTSITFGGAFGTRLANVAAGSIAAGSLDAVNGGQFHAAGSAIAAALGTTLGTNGTIDSPVFTVGGQTYSNVGDAFTNLDGRVAVLETRRNGRSAPDVPSFDDADLVGRPATDVNVTLTPGAVASGLHAMAVGTNATASGNNSAALGVNATASADNSVALGANAAASADNSIALGSNAAASADNSAALGVNATASADNSVALGANAAASADNSIALGSNAAASADNSVALGMNAAASADNSVALGANAVASADNSIALGANSVADRPDAVSVGSADRPRHVMNVAAGTQDGDAVNVSQLNAVRSQISGVQQSVENLQGHMNRRFEQMDSRMNRIGAMSAAMTTMVASAAGLKTDNSVAVGTGRYRGQTALAFGYQRKISSRMVTTVAGSIAGGSDYNVGVSVGYGW